MIHFHFASVFLCVLVLILSGCSQVEFQPEAVVAPSQASTAPLANVDGQRSDDVSNESLPKLKDNLVCRDTPVKCDVYIARAEDFQLIKTPSSANDPRVFCLTKDISFLGKNIVTPDYVSKVYIEGKGFKITDLNARGGLFNSLDQSCVQNLKFSNGQLTSVANRNSGLLASRVTATHIRNLSVVNFSSPSVLSSQSCGLLAGEIHHSEVSNIQISFSELAMDCEYFGGLTGTVTVADPAATRFQHLTKYNQLNRLGDRGISASDWPEYYNSNYNGPLLNKFSNIKVSGNVTTTRGRFAGGVIGAVYSASYNHGEISDISYTGNIRGTFGTQFQSGAVGGLFGSQAGFLSVRSAKFIGQIISNGGQAVGGLAGNVRALPDSNPVIIRDVEVRSIIAAQVILPKVGFVGGLVGFSESLIVSDASVRARLDLNGGAHGGGLISSLSGAFINSGEVTTTFHGTNINLQAEITATGYANNIGFAGILSGRAIKSFDLSDSIFNVAVHAVDKTTATGAASFALKGLVVDGVRSSARLSVARNTLNLRFYGSSASDYITEVERPLDREIDQSLAVLTAPSIERLLTGATTVGFGALPQLNELPAR
jgi:hypothetical protein